MRVSAIVLLLLATLGRGVEAQTTSSTSRGQERSTRTWTDASGNFKVKAKFVRIDGALVVLQRDEDQKEIRVPLERLSETDRTFLKRETKPLETGEERTQTRTTPKRDRARDDVWAVAGFNNRKGLGTRRGRRGPYQLDTLSLSAGNGEPGWNGAWSVTDRATAQSKLVFEGDGALHLEGTAGVRRSFARPLDDIVEIEQYVCAPVGGHVICYIWEQNHASSGPMWSINGGKILTLAGDERGSGKWTPTGHSVTEDEWFKVVIEIDTAKRRWKLKLPDKDYVSAELKYRGTPKQLLAIHFLAETKQGIFIDAIQVRQAKAKSP